MILELKLTNDAGEVVAYTKSDHPEQPLQWRSPPNQPVIFDKNKNDVIFIHSYTVQPLCTLQLNYRKGINIESIPVQFETKPVQNRANNTLESYGPVSPNPLGTQFRK